MKEINLKEKFENLPPMLIGGIRGEWKSEGSSENFREVANYPNCEKLNGDKFKKTIFWGRKLYNLCNRWQKFWQIK